ncbi:MAG: lytic murein transglycosylase B [Woeseiaceae bacterium]|nr:lytic murein transglycosylase B [Woeseiaceae bacterium]
MLLITALSSPAVAFDTGRDDVAAFIDRMVDDHEYDRAALEAALREAQSIDRILEAIARPAEKTLTWPEYRQIFIRPEKIGAGVEFWRDNEAAIRAVSEATGVSEEMLVGIIGVETNFGRITGNYRVLDALATLAFDYPPRSSFFTQQLEEFLLLVREENLSATEPTGSYAGAMGRPQFMPGSYRAYAVDIDGDGRRDIWSNWQDVLGSVANYFVEHDWKPGKAVVTEAKLGAAWQGEVPANRLSATGTVAELRSAGVEFETDLPGDHPAALVTLELGDGDREYRVGFHNFFVITRYNRNVMYAAAVEEMGRAVAQAYRQ